jgi:hypothetical protein
MRDLDRIRIMKVYACCPVRHNSFKCTCCSFETGQNDFDVDIHFEGHWKGWALKIKTFLGTEMATSEASAIWAQKSQDFHGPPFPMAQVVDLQL